MGKKVIMIVFKNIKIIKYELDKQIKKSHSNF